MKREKIARLLSAHLDGELSARQTARLEKAMDGLPDADEIKLEWLRIRSRLRQGQAQPPMMPAAAWDDIQRRIRTETEPQNTSVFISPWLKAVAGAASAAIIAGVSLWMYLANQGENSLAGTQSAEVVWVEAGSPEAMSMVYKDVESGWTVIWVEVEEGPEGNKDA